MDNPQENGADFIHRPGCICRSCGKSLQRMTIICFDAPAFFPKLLFPTLYHPTIFDQHVMLKHFSYSQIIPLGLLFLVFYLSCDPPHTIKAKRANGTEYEAPHYVVGEGTNDNEHTYLREFTPEEKQAVENFAAQKIADWGFTADQVKKTSPATQSYDCHGLTLDDGRTWIDNDYAEDIARAMGYKEISNCNPNTPQVGDIIIYRNANGDVVHTGKVISTTGGKVKIHSKWGSWPNYEHDVDAVPPSYGNNVSYYRKC